jgi:hypothetical protein
MPEVRGCIVSHNYSIRQHTSAYVCNVSISQHTSAYVSIRLEYEDILSHTLSDLAAYVSIRQHTSAYAWSTRIYRLALSVILAANVSIRQHTPGVRGYIVSHSEWVWRHTSAYVRIRPHMSADVCCRRCLDSMRLFVFHSVILADSCQQWFLIDRFIETISYHANCSSPSTSPLLKCTEACQVWPRLTDDRKKRYFPHV